MSIVTSHTFAPPPPPQRYVRTFLWVLVHIAWAVFLCIGAPGTGDFAAGVMPMIRFFSGNGGTNNFLGIMCIINVAAWGTVVVGMWAVLGYAIAAWRAGNTPRMLFEQKYGMRAPV